MNILVSFPKSASDWLRYSFEYIYLRPTADENEKPVLKLKHMLTKIGKPYEIPVNGSKEPIFVKKHYVSSVKDTDKCIFSYRDYKEVVFSFMYAQVQQRNPNPNLTIEDFVKNNFNKLNPQFRQWMNNYVAYYNHKGDKHIMDYNNLLKNPKDEINYLIEFLTYNEIDLKRKEEFFKNIEEHINNSIEYKKHPSHMPNNSFGTKQKYSEKLLSEKQHKYIDDFMKSINEKAFLNLQNIYETRHNTI